MCIHIRNSKGERSRVTQLSELNRQILRQYLKNYFSSYDPYQLLFPGIPESKPLSTRTAQRVFQEALERSKIDKPASIHCLRHSYATHLMDQGVPIRQIQALLGHSNINTTALYLHFSSSHITQIKNPMDLWMKDGEKHA